MADEEENNLTLNGLNVDIDGDGVDEALGVVGGGYTDALNAETSDISVLDLILPEIKDSPQENADPEYEAYLRQLTEASLERISQEPDRLNGERERIQSEIEGLAVQHSRSFTQSATHIHEILREVNRVHSSLESLGKDIPRLASALQKFSIKGASINEERDINVATLRQHGVLLEVLELPQLIDTCVRKGAYDEAMLLEQYTKRLIQLHPKSAVVAAVATEVRQSADLMLKRLLSDLKTTITLPECLRVVGYIRKLGVHTESQLRLEFLHCRDVWFDNILRDVPQSSGYQYLSKLTDRYRVHLFELMTHYRAIFSDDDSANGRTDASLLSSWVLHKIQSYVDVLGSLLPMIQDGALYGQLLEQVMYCGMSLGRVGIDFRSFVAPMFEECVRNLFSGKLSTARASIQDNGSGVARWQDPSSMSNTGAAAAETGRGSLAPPMSLLDHPPLAHWCNAYLAGLNDLRSCAPIALREPLAAEVMSAILELAMVLKKECGTLGLSESERTLLGKVARVANEQLIPYICECFDAVFAATRLIDRSEASAVLSGLYQPVVAPKVVTPVTPVLPPVTAE